jgi:hypothetical protein
MSNECQSSNAPTVLLIGKNLFRFTCHVIPVKTGIRKPIDPCFCRDDVWIPASAGMTDLLICFALRFFNLLNWYQNLKFLKFELWI